MNEPAEELDAKATLASLVELARDSAAEPSRADLDRGFTTLRARLATEQRRYRGLPWALAAAALLLLVPVMWRAGVLGSPQAVAAPLTYRVQGGTVLDGGYLQDSGGSGVTLVFSEGTRFAFGAGTRGRLRSLDATGAHVGLEKGVAQFDVTPDRGLRWVIEVGPFSVTVKGTSFRISWDPTSEHFELDLQQGKVAVSGPVASGELALKAGQRLVVDLAKADTLITEIQYEPNSGASTSEAVTPETLAPNPSSASPQTSASSQVNRLSPGPTPGASRARRWADAMAKGHWATVLDDVENAGVDVTLQTASSEELGVVADAARYTRRASLARQALLAQRQRFAATRRAQDAAFLLGRVEETVGKLDRALEWYGSYLSQAPSGRYAAEALFRKMTIVSETAGAAQARPIAQTYLRRFPEGKHARTARAILGTH